jgi:hypothetical protein
MSPCKENESDRNRFDNIARDCSGILHRQSGRLGRVRWPNTFAPQTLSISESFTMRRPDARRRRDRWRQQASSDAFAISLRGEPASAHKFGTIPSAYSNVPSGMIIVLFRPGLAQKPGLWPGLRQPGLSQISGQAKAPTVGLALAQAVA